MTSPTPFYNLSKVQQRIIRMALSKLNNEQIKNIILQDAEFVLRESDIIKGLNEELALSKSRHAKATGHINDFRRYLEANGLVDDYNTFGTGPAHDDNVDALGSGPFNLSGTLEDVKYFKVDENGNVLPGESTFEEFLQSIFSAPVEEVTSGTATGRISYDAPVNFRELYVGERPVGVVDEKRPTPEEKRDSFLRSVLDRAIEDDPSMLDAMMAVKISPQEAAILADLTGVKPEEAQASLDRVQQALRVIKNEKTIDEKKEFILSSNAKLPQLNYIQIAKCDRLFNNFVEDYKIVAPDRASITLKKGVAFGKFTIATTSLSRNENIEPDQFFAYLVNHRG